VRQHLFRVVLFDHSWGASEVVNLAQELDRRSIPMLLTIQVDSVRKRGEQGRDSLRECASQ